LNGLVALRDYIALLGYREHAEALNEFARQLRKLVPRKTGLKVIEYEESTGIVQRALEELSKVVYSESTVWKLVAVTAFFTGLRSTEIIYLINNIKNLRVIHHNSTVIIDISALAETRKSKKHT